MIKKLFFLMIFPLLFMPDALFSDGSLMIDQSASYLSSDPDRVIPDLSAQSGYDLYIPVNENISFFSSIDGFFGYRYLEKEWQYQYDAAVDFSFRNDNILIKPSLIANGEQIYGTDLTVPDLFENVIELYLSYDLDSSTVFLSPAASWENYNFFIKGKTGYSFSLFTNYVFTLAFSAGKTIPGSKNDEVFLTPEISFSWFSDSPVTLNSAFSYTWYDSDYVSTSWDEDSPLALYDFSGFVFNADCSVSLSRNITFSLYIPLELLFKRHDAVRDEIVKGEAEWLFSSGIQTELGIDFYTNHRCVFSLNGKKVFSNSTYQDSGEIMLSAAYEFMF